MDNTLNNLAEQLSNLTITEIRQLAKILKANYKLSLELDYTSWSLEEEIKKEKELNG